MNLISDEFTFEDKMAVLEEEAMQQRMQQVYFAFIKSK